MSWPVHPAADLFPVAGPEDFARLADDIRSRGLVEPVTLWRDESGGDVLLDGRNRVRACELIGAPIRTRRYDGDDPVSYSISQNLMRRHLTPSQCAAVALASVPLLKAEASDRQRRLGRELGGRPLASIEAKGPDQGKRSGKATAEAAALFGVSRATVERMERVERERPDLVERVAGGEVSVNAAYEAVKTGGEPLALGAGRRNDKRKPFPLDRFVSEMLGAIGAVNDWIKTEDLSSFSAEQIGRWAADLRRARPAITKMIRHLEGNLTNEECDSDDQSE